MSNKSKEIDSVIDLLRHSIMANPSCYVVCDTYDLPVLFLSGNNGYRTPLNLLGFSKFSEEKTALERRSMYSNLRVKLLRTALEEVIDKLECQLRHYRNARTTTLELESWWSKIV